MSYPGASRSGEAAALRAGAYFQGQAMSCSTAAMRGRLPCRPHSLRHAATGRSNAPYTSDDIERSEQHEQREQPEQQEALDELLHWGPLIAHARKRRESK
jgi:hypothetical protein